MKNEPPQTITIWIEQFLRARKAEKLMPGTIVYYRQKLESWATWLVGQGAQNIQDVTSQNLRDFILYLEETNHSPGGIHSYYRSVKAFLNWYEDEADPENWKNPIRKVKPPKVDSEPLKPIALKDFEAMIATCSTRKFTDVRDKALLMFMLDTGLRAEECVAIDINDVDLVTGDVVVKRTKARKSRAAYIEKTTRKYLRIYIKSRTDTNTALWVTDEGERLLTKSGMRFIFERRAKRAGVPVPTARSFRRAFAINFLRNNPGDIYNLRKLMGHKGLSVLIRYLELTDQDAKDAHRRGSPVENL